MDDLLRRVERYARRYGLWKRGETVVVGVSGGPDSLCLLHVMGRLAGPADLRLHVAHLNHGLRGADADADAAFVSERAAAWGLPCTIGRSDVRALADRPGVSVEEAARQARYRFLAEVAAATGAHTIAVGHNADDQAETVLMHFLRGSGLAGLRGMLPRARLEDGDRGRAGAAGAWLVRPLLETPRSDIAAYCAAHGLQPRVDLSNLDPAFYRNRLRHDLLPLLEQYNPGIRRVLGHTATVMAGDFDIVEDALAAAWEDVVLPTPDGAAGARPSEIRFDRARWRALPLGVQRGLVRRAVRTLRRSLRNINWEHVERAVWLGREGVSGQSATLAAGLALQVGPAALRIAAEGSAWLEDVPQVNDTVALAAPGTTVIGGWQVEVRRLDGAGIRAAFAGFPDAPDPWTACLDAAATGPDLILRPVQPGERFRPQGLGGHTVRISEFMTNVKAPHAARPGWPVLAGRGGVAWLCGLRVDERAALRPDTAQAWRVTVRRAAGAPDGG